MRSLALKLTLAFLVVGLIGAVMVAAFVGLRTEREFGRFVLDRYQADLIQNLADYYEEKGSWDGLDAIVIRMPYMRGGMEFTRAPVTLVDAEGRVIYGGRRYRAGQQVDRDVLKAAVPVELNGKVAGLVLFNTLENNPRPAASPEADFLARVRQAILFGALGATAIALLLGILLARTISQPVRALTRATQRIAQGELGHQVEVEAEDELGELAHSFNHMSADLARASQLRRQMTADIAHDLRTPLTVILGYTEALADGKIAGRTEVYQAMHEEAQHLQHLIEDLRTLSLADAGELRLHRQTCSPRRLLERAVATYQWLAEQEGLTLRIEAPPGLPDLQADPERMAQVLNNLVGNALRFTPAGGEVVLSADVSAGALHLRVADSGPGIPAADLPHVFERFYKGDMARSRGGESGLGLAIARSLVEAHGGAISVESPPGQGATFTVTLPLADKGG